MPGNKKPLEEGAIVPMEVFSDSAGFLGYMILKRIGDCAVSSFMMDPQSMVESLQTLGANPPEYLIHSEWDAQELAQLGFGKVLMNARIKKIHDDGVMAI
jgi:hypothetical protein